MEQSFDNKRTILAVSLDGADKSAAFLNLLFGEKCFNENSNKIESHSKI